MWRIAVQELVSDGYTRTGCTEGPSPVGLEIVSARTERCHASAPLSLRCARVGSTLVGRWLTSCSSRACGRPRLVRRDEVDP
jgi:hypothetical protein